MVSTELLVQLLSLGHETRGFEAKGPGSAGDSHFFARVARAALSLGNLRDGGIVVIGVNDNELQSMSPGLDSAQAASWTSFDVLSRALAEYSDPPLRFHSQLVTLPSEARVLAIEVEEFADVPHICMKGFDTDKGKTVLKRGAVYVRTRRLPETSEVASAEQMRELLDLATEKALAAYVRTAQRAGLELSPTEDHGAVPQAQLFDAEREAGWR